MRLRLESRAGFALHRKRERERKEGGGTHDKERPPTGPVYTALVHSLAPLTTLLLLLLVLLSPAPGNHLSRPGPRTRRRAERPVNAGAHAREAGLPALEALLDRRPVLRGEGLDRGRARDGERARGLREAAEEERGADG